jgi:hypothetical protein
MFEFVEFLSLSNPLELCSDHFSGWQSWPGGTNEDLTFWLDAARLPPKYVLKNNISSKYSKIWPTQTLQEKGNFDIPTIVNISQRIVFHYLAK